MNIIRGLLYGLYASIGIPVLLIVLIGVAMWLFADQLGGVGIELPVRWHGIAILGVLFLGGFMYGALSAKDAH